MVHVFGSMNIEIDRTGQIQREDTHDRFCVNDITSGDEIEIIIKLGEVIYKRFDLVDRIQRNRYCFHNTFLLFLSGAEHLFEDITNTQCMQIRLLTGNNPPFGQTVSIQSI